MWGKTASAPRTPQNLHTEASPLSSIFIASRMYGIILEKTRQLSGLHIITESEIDAAQSIDDESSIKGRVIKASSKAPY